ncbi:MAG: hypothetical protein ACJ741_06545 [Pyrinomonadaceae bacterium]
MKDKLGSIVMKRYGGGRESDELCEVVSSLAEPSYHLRQPDGHVFTWAQSLTRPATHEEEVAYWRARAERTEGAKGDVFDRVGEAMEGIACRTPPLPIPPRAAKLELWETDYFDRSRVVAVTAAPWGERRAAKNAMLHFDGGAMMEVDKTVAEAVAWVNGSEPPPAVQPVTLEGILRGAAISCTSNGEGWGSITISFKRLEDAQACHRLLSEMRAG